MKYNFSKLLSEKDKDWDDIIFIVLFFAKFCLISYVIKVEEDF